MDYGLGMNTFQDLISAFGGPEGFAKAIGVRVEHARQMVCRNAITHTLWPKIVAQAPSNGVEGVTYDLLFSLESGRDPATIIRRARRKAAGKGDESPRA